MGHEERFPPTRLSAGCGFRKETIADLRGTTLSRANLSGAHLDGANFFKAEGGAGGCCRLSVGATSEGLIRASLKPRDHLRRAHEPGALEVDICLNIHLWFNGFRRRASKAGGRLEDQ